MDKWDSQWKYSLYSSEDNYWAGAKKACDELGMSLPDESKLQSIYNAGQKDSSLGLPTSGYFWSSSERNVDSAYYVGCGNGRTSYGYKGAGGKVLCVGD